MSYISPSIGYQKKSIFEPTSKDIAFDILLMENGSIDFDKGLETLEATMKIFKKSLEHSKKNNRPLSYQLWNTAALINKCSYDLRIVIYYFINEKRDWNRRYFMGQMCLVIYEGLNDLQRFFGKEIADILSKLKNSDIYYDELNEIRKDLNLFKEKNKNELFEIRNNVVAPKDNDVLNQLKTIEQLNRSELSHLAVEFDGILNKSGKLLMRMIKASDGRLN